MFTHDHFGPSTHQQVGLYAGLLIEPEDSTWFTPDGTQMFTRGDGGPTEWQGFIKTVDPAKSYREFAFEFQDTQLAYLPSSKTAVSAPARPLTSSLAFAPALTAGLVPQPLKAALAGVGITLQAGAELVRARCYGPKTPSGGYSWNTQWALDDKVVAKGATVTRFCLDQASGNLTVYTPELMAWSDPSSALGPFALSQTPTGDTPPANTNAPYVQLISFTGGAIGTYSVNYRNEPLPYRLTPAGSAGSTDLSRVFRSDLQRGNPALRVQPKPGSPIFKNSTFTFPPFLSPTTAEATSCTASNAAGGTVQPCDPFTPLLRAYAGDKVTIRTLVGAHLQPHSFRIPGIKWLFEPSSENSGYKDTQSMGLSEHFEMLFDLPPTTVRANAPRLGSTDYLYAASADTVGLTNGAWGIFRSYNATVPGLTRLPNNPEGLSSGVALDYEALFNAAAAAKRPTRNFEVTATTVAKAVLQRKPLHEAGWRTRLQSEPCRSTSHRPERPNLRALQRPRRQRSIASGRSERTTDSEGQRRRVAEDHADERLCPGRGEASLRHGHANRVCVPKPVRPAAGAAGRRQEQQDQLPRTMVL